MAHLQEHLVKILFFLLLTSNGNSFQLPTPTRSSQKARTIRSVVTGSSQRFLSQSRTQLWMNSKTPKTLVTTSLVALTIATLGASNAVASGIDNVKGDFADPLRPYCQRHIEATNVDLFYTGSSVGNIGDPKGCVQWEQQKYGTYEASLNMLLLDDGKISAGEHEGVKPSIAEEGTKWVFLIYVVFSIAAGIKEMGSRFLNWKENRSNS